MKSFLKVCALNAFLLVVGHALFAQNSKKSFVWGVNGHPLTQQDYKYSTLNDQIQSLRDLGVNYYRIDVPINKEGKARNDTYFSALLLRLNAVGIKPMLALFPSGVKSENLDSSAVYAEYFAVGRKFIKRYGGYLDVVEIGNEWDLKLMKKNAMNDGTKASHYQSALIPKQMWLLAGIVDGMKKEKPTLKVSMSLTWVHWYYLDILRKYRINYDIIGYHWYSNMGNITKMAAPYGDFLPKIAQKYKKEIWITEFNTHKGNQKSSFDKQNEYIKTSLEDILNQKVVTGCFIYELFDQPSLKRYPDEVSYGMLYLKNGKYQRKPIYYTFKKIINTHK